MHITELVILEYYELYMNYIYETDIIILILHIMMLLFYMFSLVCVVRFLARKEHNFLAIA